MPIEQLLEGLTEDQQPDPEARPRRKRTLQGPALKSCYEAGLYMLTSTQAAALVAITRRCARSEQGVGVATWDQIAEDTSPDFPLFSVSTLRRTVRLARREGWIHVEWTKIEHDLNAPNTFILRPPLKELARLVAPHSVFAKANRAPKRGSLIGWSKNVSPMESNKNQQQKTNLPTSYIVEGDPKVGSPKPQGPEIKLPTHQTERPRQNQKNCSGSRARRFETDGPLTTTDDHRDIAEAGLQLLEDEHGLTPERDSESQLDRALQLADFLEIGVTPSVLERGIDLKGIWAVLAFIETAIKTTTHTRIATKIRKPRNYWDRVTYTPFQNRNRPPISGVVATINGHAEYLARGEGREAPASEPETPTSQKPPQTPSPSPARAPAFTRVPPRIFYYFDNSRWEDLDAALQEMADMSEHDATAAMIWKAYLEKCRKRCKSPSQSEMLSLVATAARLKTPKTVQ
ncbi:MAG: hypothetical protein QNJ84_19015 [Alphaproteobacteria bacterium]|nr:hypothetical protein [Alphaproteobacteria bacterium]